MANPPAPAKAWQTEQPVLAAQDCYIKHQAGYCQHAETMQAIHASELQADFGMAGALLTLAIAGFSLLSLRYTRRLVSATIAQSEAAIAQSRAAQTALDASRQSDRVQMRAKSTEIRGRIYVNNVGILFDLTNKFSLQVKIANSGRGDLIDLNCAFDGFLMLPLIPGRELRRVDITPWQSASHTVQPREEYEFSNDFSFDPPNGAAFTTPTPTQVEGDLTFNSFDGAGLRTTERFHVSGKAQRPDEWIPIEITALGGPVTFDPE